MLGFIVMQMSKVNREKGYQDFSSVSFPVTSRTSLNYVHAYLKIVVCYLNLSLLDVADELIKLKQTYRNAREYNIQEVLTIINREWGLYGENLKTRPCRIDRFSRKNRTFEVHKLFIIRLFAFLEARNRPESITGG